MEHSGAKNVRKIFLHPSIGHPIIVINIPQAGKSVKPCSLLSRPRFSRKEPMDGKNPEERRGAHGVQAGGIRIIILRRLFFHRVGPVPRGFAREDVLARSCLCRYFPAGLSLRRIGGKVIGKR